MKSTQALNVVRYVLSFGGGLLVTVGYLTAEDVQTALTAVETMIGGGSTLVGIGWTVINAFKSKKAKPVA